MILVSLYDSKAKTYTTPHVSANEETAVRELRMLVNDKSGQSQISLYPEDFSLFSFGEWFERVPVEGSAGDFTAKLVAYPAPRAIANAINLKDPSHDKA